MTHADFLHLFQFWPHFNNPLVLGGLRLVLEAETSSSGYQAVRLRLEAGAEQHTVQVRVMTSDNVGIMTLMTHNAGGVLPQLASPECAGQ